MADGIGANSTIFSVVNGVVLKPLPYQDPERLVFVTTAFPTMGFDKFWMSQPEYQEYAEWGDAIVDLGAYNTGEISITGRQSPVRVSSATVTRSFFTVLGVEPAVGRVFTAEEDAPGGSLAVVLSWELWQRAFGGRDAAVGETVEINGQTSDIVGVMPAGFDINDNGTEVWAPLQLDAAAPRPRGNHFLFSVGRLVP